MNARLDLVPGVGHDGLKVLPQVMAFFREGLDDRGGGKTP